MIKEEDVEPWATDRGLALKFKSLIRFATDQIFWRWTVNNRPSPLIGTNGQVLGVNTFGFRGAQGLNFAISVADLRFAFSRQLR